MAKSLDSMINDIIRREGGFFDHPADRGGPTRFGITHKILARHLDREVTCDDVRQLWRELAAEIYRRAYYLEPRIDNLPPSVRAFLFDSAVNHGSRRAIKFLQQVLNAAGFGPLSVDGLAGPMTHRKAKTGENVMGPWLLAALAEERQIFYRLIVERVPSQRVFFNGWMKRVSEFDHRIERLAAWDSFVDGLNRLPRPLITLGILGLCILSPADPICFFENARAYQIMPDGFWALLSIVIAFYIGGRMQVTKQQMTITGGVLDAAKEIVKVRKEFRDLTEEEQPASERAYGLAALTAQSDARTNVVTAWLKRQRARDACTLISCVYIGICEDGTSIAI